MLCQICQQAEACIHTLDLDGGAWVQHHLCDKCALGASPSGTPPESNVIKFFGQILAQAKAGSDAAGDVSAETRCPGCNMTYDQFQHSRRLGCARCYEKFEADLEQIFLRVQDKAVHCGKVPGRPTSAPPSPLELRRLEERLRRAVQEERFEEAALYRDKIKELSDDPGEPPVEG